MSRVQRNISFETQPLTRNLFSALRQELQASSQQPFGTSLCWQAERRVRAGRSPARRGSAPRRWRDADVDEMAAINADPDVMQHFVAPLDAEQTAARPPPATRRRSRQRRLGPVGRRGRRQRPTDRIHRPAPRPLQRGLHAGGAPHHEVRSTFVAPALRLRSGTRGAARRLRACRARRGRGVHVAAQRAVMARHGGDRHGPTTQPTTSPIPTSPKAIRCATRCSTGSAARCSAERSREPESG